jgi:hypothetical protein
MIEPFSQGPELIEEILGTHPFHGSLAIWWLGQSGFLIKIDGGILVIDPYLSEHLTRKYEGTSRPHDRMTGAPRRGAAVIFTWGTSSRPRGSGCIIVETAWRMTGWPRSWDKSHSTCSSCRSTAGTRHGACGGT